MTTRRSATGRLSLLWYCGMALLGSCLLDSLLSDQIPHKPFQTVSRNDAADETVSGSFHATTNTVDPTRNTNGNLHNDNVYTASSNMSFSPRQLGSLSAKRTFEFNTITTILVIVLVLIFMTIVFEEAKDAIEESTASNMRLIVNHLFAEMTVLGFLSMFTFLFSKSGLFTVLSQIIFQDTTTLADIFELVHFTIFFVMIFFVLQVLVLARGAMKSQDEWLRMERDVRNPLKAHVMEERAKHYYGDENDNRASSSQHGPLWEIFHLLPFMRRYNMELHENEILYKALRDEFILERSVDPPFAPFSSPEKRLQADFNFGRYLGIALGQMCGQIVDLNRNAWAFFMVLAVLYWGFVLLIHKNVEILAWTWAGLAWVQYFYNLNFERHLIHVRRAFAHKELFRAVRLRQTLLPNNGHTNGLRGSWLQATDETTFLKRSLERTGSCQASTRSILLPHENDNSDDEEEQLLQQSNHQDGLLPLWTEVDLDAYMERRSLWARWFVGGRPSRQQTFYWMDAHGPRFYPFILQINLIFVGVFVSLNVLGFLGYMYKTKSLPVFIIYTITAFLPVLGVMFLKRKMIAAMSTVCALGAYRRPGIISKVLRDEKTNRIVRAFLIIYELRKLALRAEDGIHDIPEGDETPLRFDDFETTEIAKTFDAFDSSGDGNISYDEFETLMSNIGARMSPTALNRMIAVLDADQNGQVNRDEFVAFYARHSANDTSSIEERARFLFGLFDDDGSGTLTIGEFKQRVDALNVGFSVDDIGAIVNELDCDRDGSIGPEEFVRLIEQHYPMELRENLRR